MFNTFYRGMVELWRKAKTDEDKVTADALKNTVNSVFR